MITQIDSPPSSPPGPPPPARSRRGRPRGRTAQGHAARDKLFAVAIAQVAARGYEATTLRDIAREAGVSAALLYRYFPGKRAVVLALYDDLSAEYAARAASLPPGPWRTRFLAALRTSLEVLRPQRAALAALLPVLAGGGEQGLFAASTGFSRQRVRAAFLAAATEASDAPRSTTDAEALGRVLYVVHLLVILWWLADRSPGQRATQGLLALLERALPPLSLALRLGPARAWLRRLDALSSEALLGTAGGS